MNRAMHRHSVSCSGVERSRIAHIESTSGTLVASLPGLLEPRKCGQPPLYRHSTAAHLKRRERVAHEPNVLENVIGSSFDALPRPVK